MANIERLTKRVMKMEEWIAENGDGETVTNYNFLINAYRNAEKAADDRNRELGLLRQLLSEWLKGKEQMDE